MPDAQEQTGSLSTFLSGGEKSGLTSGKAGRAMSAQG